MRILSSNHRSVALAALLGRKNKSTHINSRKVVAGGWGGVWENRERFVKGYTFSNIKLIRSEDLMYSLVTINDKIVLKIEMI